MNVVAAKAGSSATAARAVATAVREASDRSRPERAAASRTGAAALTAASDASSGMADEETPSQRTATTVGSPPG